MVIATEVCDSFLSDAITALLSAEYKVALIRRSAGGNYGKATASYSELAGDEVQGAGYVRGGAALKNPRIVLRDERVCLTFDSVQWPSADIVAEGALIYSPSRGGSAVCVLGFGNVYAAVGGETFQLPIDCPVRL